MPPAPPSWPDPREQREQADEQQDRHQELDDDLPRRLARLLVDVDDRAVLRAACASARWSARPSSGRPPRACCRSSVVDARRARPASSSVALATCFSSASSRPSAERDAARRRSSGCVEPSSEKNRIVRTTDATSRNVTVAVLDGPPRRTTPRRVPRSQRRPPGTAPVRRAGTGLVRADVARFIRYALRLLLGLQLDGRAS